MVIIYLTLEIRKDNLVSRVLNQVSQAFSQSLNSRSVKSRSGSRDGSVSERTRHDDRLVSLRLRSDTACAGFHGGTCGLA